MWIPSGGVVIIIRLHSGRVRIEQTAGVSGHVQEPSAARGEQRHLEDCTAGRDFHSGDSPRIQDYESLAVSTTQNPGCLGQRGDDVVDDLGFAARLAILVRDIDAVAAGQPNTKHNRFHVPHTRRAWRQPAMRAPSHQCGMGPRLKTPPGPHRTIAP